MNRIKEIAVAVGAGLLLVGCGAKTQPAEDPSGTSTQEMAAAALLKPQPHNVDGKVHLDATVHSEQAGVLFESCVEGGTNAVGLEAGDWLDFYVDVKRGGLYAVDCRFANGGTNGATAAILSGSRTLSEFLLPPTGGWQNWTTARSVISLGSGPQRLRLECTKTGCNVHWIELDPMLRQP